MKRLITLPQISILKESPEQRLARARKQRAMGTKIEQNKKKYNRKEKHKKEYDYES